MPKRKLIARMRRPAVALGQLRSDRKGLALIEFALILPVIIAAGCWCAEISFLALTNLRISQYALNLADNASRVGIEAAGNVVQLRESDIDDVLLGAKLQGDSIDLASRGRVTIASLEKVQQSYDKTRVQRLHWQRCFGAQMGSSYQSKYGTVKIDAASEDKADKAGNDAPNGIDENGVTVNAIDDTGVMLVEINYLYRPLFGNLFVQPRIIRYAAQMMVRENRDWTKIYSPDKDAPKMTCDQSWT